jgi:hypothetical protein
MADAPTPPAPPAPPPDKVEPLPSTVFISEKRGGNSNKRA